MNKYFQLLGPILKKKTNVHGRGGELHFYYIISPHPLVNSECVILAHHNRSHPHAVIAGEQIEYSK